MRLKARKGNNRNRPNNSSYFNINIYGNNINSIYSSTKNSTKLERETEAMYYAVDTIETVKSLDFLQLPKKGTEKIENIDNLKDGYIKDKMGNITSYYRTITVQDYTEMAGKEKRNTRNIKKSNSKNFI